MAHEMERQRPDEGSEEEGEPSPFVEQTLGQPPPVLPVSSSSLPERPPATAAASKASATPSLQVKKTDDPGASELWGLSEEIDKWQVSSMPEKQQYFAMDANHIDAAVSAVKARLDETDTNIRGSWLLTEIDHWDLEKERLLLLSDNNLISIKYNFIQNLVEELKYIPFKHITEVIEGEFKYTYSYVYSRRGRGLKINWGRDDRVSFLDRWNPVSTRIPHTVLTSHVLVRRGRIDNPRMKLASLVPELENAVGDWRRANVSSQPSGEGSSATEEFKVQQGDIVFDTYFGLSALVHNQSHLGFNKRRGAMDW